MDAFNVQVTRIPFILCGIKPENKRRLFSQKLQYLENGIDIGQLNPHILKINTSEEQLSKCLCKYNIELIFLCDTA